MFEFDFGVAKNKSRATPDGRTDGYNDVEKLHLVHWREHCVECSAPSCFSTCHLYAKRADMMCARFKRGITQDYAHEGIAGCSAGISFKRWGKLECEMRGAKISPRTLHLFTKVDLCIISLVRVVAEFFNPMTRIRKLNTYIVYAKIRKWTLTALSAWKKSKINQYDVLRVDLTNPLGKNIVLILEIATTHIQFRKRLTLHPGYNRFDISVRDIVGANSTMDHTFHVNDVMRLYPDADQEIDIILHCAYFLKVKKTHAAIPPLSKIKVVVWDLDNTLWDGTLVEDGMDALSLRAGLREVMEALDQRGVLQSIASKNDHAPAWKLVEKIGVAKYMLFPQINWNAKSANIKAIAEQLNLGTDSILFIDDSVYERNEVIANVPGVKTMDEREALQLLLRPDIPQAITEESKNRRALYQVDAERKKGVAHFSNQLDFLKSCELIASVFCPESDREQERCMELMSRTNQFNISKRTLSPEDLKALIASKEHMVEAIACSDRYGDYGIVGFLIVSLEGDHPLITDFILSCRVAKKFVEHAWMQSVLRRMKSHDVVYLRFRPTERNSHLYETLLEMGFKVESQIEQDKLLKIPANVCLKNTELVTVSQR